VEGRNESFKTQGEPSNKIHRLAVTDFRIIYAVKIMRIFFACDINGITVMNASRKKELNGGRQK
jgi:mRNA-degrading endonuclease RelE of RelBE toxin-antitoxin system